MPETVTLKFKAPAPNGARTWLHERSGPKQVPHASAPDGVTTKVMPKVLIQDGETFEVEANMAETLIKRNPECFSLASKTTTSSTVTTSTSTASSTAAKFAAKKAVPNILPEDED